MRENQYNVARGSWLVARGSWLVLASVVSNPRLTNNIFNSNIEDNYVLSGENLRGFFVSGGVRS